MIKKIKNNKQIKITLIIISIIIAILILFNIGYRIKTGNWIFNIKNENPKEIQYQIENIEGNKATILVSFYNENGINQITYQKNGEMTLNCNGKTKVSIEYDVEDQNSYSFLVEDKGKNKKELTLEFEIPRIQGVYSLKNGVYSNEPDVSTGFIAEKTRYLRLNEEGNLIPSGYISEEKPENWYDYKEQKWANIYVEDEGLGSYYVWIPRYCYKLDSTTQRSDVKFINVYNEYIDGTTGEKMTWEELQEQGYQLPEAFLWNSQFDEHALKQNVDMIIPGYWMSKYQLGELTSYTIDYSPVVNLTSIEISNLKVNTTKTIDKYVYALNGKIYATEDSTSTGYTFENLTGGDKIINVTALDANGEIVGSMTKTIKVTEPNEPDVSAFDKDTTFYVYWDEDGNEHNEIPISQDPPTEWYNYTSAHWANIVTRNNGLETYLTWIPRYEYKLNQINQRTYINFIQGTSTDVSEGYQIPESFSWGDDLSMQLTGYWMSKYQLNDGNATNKVMAEIKFGENKINVGELTGRAITEENIAEGLKIEYYINGEKKHEGTDINEKYTYTGLNSGETYTVNIIVRKNSNNEFLGAVTQKDATVAPNKPEISAFNENNTYYVIYDDNGNEIVGDKIKNDGSNIPSNWYDYSNNIWANIVTTDGRVENGKILDATNTTYFVWIPRYQYKLNTTTQRADIKFISGTSTEVKDGYQIPEAFSWGDDLSMQLTGYWMTKYQLND